MSDCFCGGRFNCVDCLKERIESLQAENQRLREALEEMAKPPYKDSDLKSLMEWVNARARAALEGE